MVPSLLLVVTLALSLSPLLLVSGQTCTASNNTVTVTRCPELAGIMVPPGYVDVPSFYDVLVFNICKECKGTVGQRFTCAMIYELWNADCPGEQPALAIKRPCRTSCEAVNAACASEKSTFNGTMFPIAVCNALPDTDCTTNSKGDLCHKPPWLERKSGGAPNWVWIFIVGLGGFLLILVALALALFCMKREMFEDAINPCKWCECCPKYYDL